MKCLVCDSELTERTTDFSLKVMLCQGCAIRVSKTRDRIRSEVEVLLATVDDAMRFAVLSKDLPSEDLSRDGMLKFIIAMDKLCRQGTRSLESTRLSATTVAGGRSSNSP
jgi:hypothetical protein